MSDGYSRRDALKSGLFAATAALAGSSIVVRDAHAAEPAVKSGGLRFVHMTDMHVQPELRAGEGWAAALDSLKQLNPKPQLIITGGDHVFDTFDQTPERAAIQWDLYLKTLADHTDLKTHAVMGNHDVCGWGEHKRFPFDDPGYGKRYALNRLKRKMPFTAFDAGDWRFILLDSITRRETGYYGSLGDEQSSWLADELERVGEKRPICIVSHLPIMSVAAYFDSENLKDTYWHVPDAVVHRDMVRVLNAIERYNVRLCLSGHLHQLDRCEYHGKTFLCDGSISGNWWKGHFKGCPEGYGVIDIWPDGTFEHRYQTYGWRAELPQ